MTKEKKISIIALIVLLGFTFAVFYHYILGEYLRMPVQYRTFLACPEEGFGDFLLMMINIQNFSPYAQVDNWMNYFPFMYIILYPFSKIPILGLSLLLYESIFIFFFAWISAKKLHCEKQDKLDNYKNIIIITFLSAPFLSLVDRANSDMILFIVFCGFIFLYQTKRYNWAAFLLGFLSGCKPYFWLFYLLFLEKKKYKQIILSGILAFSMFIGGFLILKGGFMEQLSTYIINLRTIQHLMAHGYWDGIQYGSSLYWGLKAFLVVLPAKEIVSTNTLVFFYKFLSIILTLVTISGFFFSRTLWKKITFLTIYMLLVPPIVYDYKYIFLMVPIWLFINTKEKTKHDYIYATLFALLLIPKSIILKDAYDGRHFVVLSEMLNPLIALSFLLLLFKDVAPNIKKILSIPIVYSLWQWLVGDYKLRKIYCRDFIRAKSGSKILDIGCGPANMLKYLPKNIEYEGFDDSKEYIEYARKKYPNENYQFFQKRVNCAENFEEKFDIIMANAILHHIDDEEADKLISFAKANLKEGGRLITLDGCFTNRQSKIKTFLLKNDRGKYVRTSEQYEILFRKHFKNIKISIREDLYNIPYTIIIIEAIFEQQNNIEPQ